ncbi:MAG TPA: alpha/beta hydrolase-fold protein [Candidatus Angelobacter sp.]|nr:alpha/beta hydrolase-fold protein [Candidatus Angelobacter sp.]
MRQSHSPASLPSRLHKHTQFASALVDEKHDFIVYVPQAFRDDPSRFFPVLFLHDGQNLFDPETSFIKGNYWRVGETADAMIASGEVEPLVIVGIYNAGVKRINEYTPSEDRRLGGGQADAYGQMLVEELKPFVAHHYRTLAGSGNCGMGGSSLGGLVTLYLGMQYPDVFGKLAVLSPSVWWRDRVILRYVEELRQPTGQKIWLDIGTNEGKRALPDARALKRTLIKKGWRQGKDLEYREIEGAQHTEYAWAERVGPLLKFLFPRRR